MENHENDESGVRHQQRRRRMALPISINRGPQKFHHVAARLRTGGQRRPDALAPSTPLRAVSPLRDSPIDHHEANRLLGQVVRRLDARRGNKDMVRNNFLDFASNSITYQHGNEEVEVIENRILNRIITVF
jgi:hypothetical protein